MVTDDDTLLNVPRLLRVFNHHSLAYARQAVVKAAEQTPSEEHGFFVWNASGSDEAIVFSDPVHTGDAPHATASVPYATNGTKQ